MKGARMKQQRIPQVGDIVTCKLPVEAYNYWYYRRQHGREVRFTPDMRGVVVDIAAKVRLVKDGVHFCSKETFLVVDFETETGTERVGLNWCNAVVVERTAAMVCVRCACGKVARITERRRNSQAQPGAAPITFTCNACWRLPDILEGAFEAWCGQRAYIDGNGNYHIRGDRVSGPIAAWNKEVKRAYVTVSDFAKAAHAWKDGTACTKG